jgi:hypothetical protein
MASKLIKGGRVLSPEGQLDGELDVRIEDNVISEIWVLFQLVSNPWMVGLVQLGRVAA